MTIELFCLIQNIEYQSKLYFMYRYSNEGIYWKIIKCKCPYVHHNTSYKPKIWKQSKHPKIVYEKEIIYIFLAE